jgi:3-phenylpropionate/cinnamic acid dioxygenase small subunit
MTTHGAGTALDQGRLPAELAWRVEQFLFREAQLLDERRFEEWLALFCEDATYEAPLRVTRERQVDSELSPTGRIFWDSKQTLGVRVQRLCSDFAWAEQPPSRTRHFVTNVRCWRANGVIQARCNLLVYRNRGEDPRADLYSADRLDDLLEDGEDFRIRRRVLVVDQANLTGNSLSVLL